MKPDGADRYVAWLESTPAHDLPPGRDVSDLAALGETRFVDVAAEELARRVAVARNNGREWWRIAQYLGITERQARAAYGTASERRQAMRHRISGALRDLLDAVREELVGEVEAVRQHWGD
jgi:hypothetical protein